MEKTTQTIDRELIKKTIDLLDMIKSMELGIQKFKDRYFENLCKMNDKEIIELSKILKRREQKL